MAPKPLHKLGSVKPHGNGWRAVVQLKHGDECCPSRTTRCAADADLARMRGANSREEMPRIARAIRERAWELAAASPSSVATPCERAHAAASVVAVSPCDTASTLEGLGPSWSATAAEGVGETQACPFANVRKCMGTSGN